ncbi:GNAT family N-acetyltransferase [Tenacibaculum maritimum]|nr:GNAT family N-acetyltransferase [Tenacibaculum maritimum]MDB0600995.1 GNAT family N-acetyltransferase [Tenacibaculum maritimum]MDB0611891.1 GNAT family N-acetyltransferase [Tenacibaculum maritimum]
MVQFNVSSSIEELEEILTLQKENLPFNLSEIERQEQGFVTVEHNLAILKEMHLVHPHIIAKDKGKVVGYALSMSSKFKDDIAILKPMFTEINNSSKANERFIVMGQICIHKEYRRKGVFKGLYTKMKKEFCNDYTAIITEIDLLNTRSINAHKAIGFKNLSTYTANNQNWQIVFMEL